MRRIRYLLIVVCMILGCSKSEEPNQNTPNFVSGAESYAVASVMLDTLYLTPSFSYYYDRILVRQRTSELLSLPGDTLAIIPPIRQAFPDAPDNLIWDFFNKNQQPLLWKDSLHLTAKYGWAADSSLYRQERCLKEIAVSRVGFDSTSQKAIVQGYFNCGDVCGEWYFCYFEKINGSWIFKGRYVYAAS